VLDTPPSRNALDFLEAPTRLTHFFEGRALRLLLAHPPVPQRDAATAAALSAAIGEALADLVLAAGERAQVLAARDQTGIQRLEEALGDVPRVLVPLLESGLGELETLGAVARELLP
jgi:anion-transporting  ArsA/GET3 family ATPase